MLQMSKCMVGRGGAGKGDPIYGKAGTGAPPVGTKQGPLYYYIIQFAARALMARPASQFFSDISVIVVPETPSPLRTHCNFLTLEAKDISGSCFA